MLRSALWLLVLAVVLFDPWKLFLDIAGHVAAFGLLAALGFVDHSRQRKTE